MQQSDQPINQRKALGYLRISDKKQMQGESIANQEDSIKKYALANNIEVIKWFKDEAKSGKNTDRNELQNLLKMAIKMKKQIDFVLVYKMSRASRDVESYITGIRSVLASKGIQIRSATEPFDDSPMGRFMENLYVGVAQLDNNIKTEMVVDNMTRIAEQGFWQHKPPRGYEKYKINNDEGKPRPSLKPNHEAPKVKNVLMRWNRGDMTEAQLTRYAGSLGIIGDTGKPLTQEVVHKLITNPIYAGYVCDKFTDYERVEGRHEPLIKREVFERNQLIFKMKSKQYLLGLKHEKINKQFPLRRFVRCVNCNEFMTGSRPKGIPRYHCFRTSCPKSSSIVAGTLHTQFEELLQYITPTKGTARLLKELFKRQVRDELGTINQDLSRVRASLDGNDGYRQRIISKYINEKISESEKKSAMNEADAERIVLELEMDKLENKQRISESNIDHALNFMANISKHWRDAPLELRQTYQELVFPTGFVYDIKNQKFITPAISPLYRVDLDKAGAINDKNISMVTLWRIELQLPG